MRSAAALVGRERELAILDTALDACRRGERRVVLVHGPGGIGKSCLLQAFVARVRTLELATVHVVDAFDVSCDASAVRQALDASEARGDGAHVIVFDRAERLAGLGDALPTELGSRLAPGTLIVIGERRPPAAWRGLDAPLVHLALRNLEREQALAYLERRRIAPSTREAIVEFSRGHPLALAIAADAGLGAPFEPSASPDVIGTLCDRFLGGLVDRTRRATVELCALIRVTTRDAIAALISEHEADALYAWLASLGFVEQRREGLVPHDLAREVLLADLRWRAPGELAALFVQASKWLVDRAVRDLDRDTWLDPFGEIAYLVRHRPGLASVADVPIDLELAPEPARADDHPAIRAMLARHEGEASARDLDRWLEAQPEAFVVLRARDGSIVGFAANVRRDLASDAVRDADRVARVAWAHAVRVHGRAPKERVLLARFWSDADGHQRPSPRASLVLLLTGRPLLERDPLAFAYLWFVDETVETWRGLAMSVGGELPDELAITARDDAPAGRLAVQDRRGLSPTQWMASVASTTSTVVAGATSDVTAPVVALDRASFGEAVGQALRAWLDDERLAESPLVWSRMVAARATSWRTGPDRVEILRALLREAVEALGEDPRTITEFQVLRAMYLTRAPSAEHARVAPRMPYVAMRGHAEIGVEKVADLLWARDCDDVLN